MNGQQHFHEAERLLLDCQLMPATENDPATYPDSEDGQITTHNALAAAQIHATLALAYAQMFPVAATDAGPCPSVNGAGRPCVYGALHAGLHARGHERWTGGEPGVPARVATGTKYLLETYGGES